MNKGVYDGKTWCGSGKIHKALSPATGEVIAEVQHGTLADYERCLSNMSAARQKWATTPAPRRGEIVRQIGLALRAKAVPLGELISLEMGKIRAEGLGEVQEFIDMCDLATGMSRQLPGQVLPSEREEHVMLETWHPLGNIGIITAFNFPCAVAGWNAAVSLVCGNTQIWKGASSTSLVTIATQKIMTDVLLQNGIDGGVATMCLGDGRQIGEAMINDSRLGMISFTGSTQIGKNVAGTVATRFGRTILELGGNNAIIIMPDANLDVALRSVLFAAVGTAGQRCTTLRRLVLHEKIYDTFLAKLKAAYANVPFGDPLAEGTLLGPLHTSSAIKEYEEGLERIKSEGGKVLYGGKRIEADKLAKLGLQGGNYVYPTIVESNVGMPVVKHELFVPIMHVLKVASFEEAVAVNNYVPQGLSSSLFTNDMRNVFKWIGPTGSDCGIINVNTSCSGAEIGGAFGGEKETGAGRESGSDAWKQYMRRGTLAINYGNNLPLAQGVNFGG